MRQIPIKHYLILLSLCLILFPSANAYSLYITEPETKEGNGVFLKIQMELLLRAGCTPKDNARCDQWIKEHAKNLRNLVDAQPEISNEWEANPEDTLTKIENQLYAYNSFRHL